MTKKKTSELEVEVSDRTYKRLTKYARKQHQSIDMIVERALRAGLRKSRREIDEPAR